MIKKLLLACLLLGISTSLFAGNIYWAPGLAITDVSGNVSNFRGLTPRLALGYRDIIGPDVWLSGEGFIALFAVPYVDDHAPGAASSKTTTDFGLSLLPALAISNEVQVFLRFGAVLTRFTASGSLTFGTQVGFGLQTELERAFNFRGEYNYTQYNNVTTLGRAKSDNFIFSLIYNWG